MEVEEPFLFFSEATGDSDAVIDGFSASLDGDDAESCSWDSADQCLYGSTLDSIVDDDFDLIDDLDCSIGDPYDLDDEEDEEEGNGEDRDCDRPWNAGEIGRRRIVRRKSSASVDSTTKESEPLNEMEKNRLFWEACLAS